MHVSALKHGQLFFDTYLGREADVTIVDIGAQDINGSLRHGAPAGCRYIGVDFVPGPGVDVVLDDPYRLPFADAKAAAAAGAQGHLQHADAAAHQGLGHRYGVVHIVQHDHRNDRCVLHDR